jgi:hypothetical protein
VEGRWDGGCPRGQSRRARQDAGAHPLRRSVAGAGHRSAGRKPRAKEYAEIRGDEQYQVVVQYRLKTWRAPADLAKSRKIEVLFNQCLGWTENGHCDGNDIGGGPLNIFCVVVDPEQAVTTLVAELRKTRLRKGAVVAVREGEQRRVVYPARFKGTFSLF